MTTSKDDNDEAMETESSDIGGVAAPTASPKLSPVKVKKGKTTPKKAAPTKRDASGVDTPPSSKRQRRPECKFGPKCYQTNPKHKEEFYHPWVRLAILHKRG